MRVDTQPAYVLHTRAYRDSSVLAEYITADFGRVSGVVKGVRGRGKSVQQRRSTVQPFVPLAISWSGRTDLKTVFRGEATGAPLRLTGDRLLSALYVNELLTRLLQHYDANPLWFQRYDAVLRRLQGEEAVETVLRRFELQLLEDLGYGVDLTVDGATGEPVQAEARYRLDTGLGVRRLDPAPARPGADSFSGDHLLAISRREFTDATRPSAKRLCRLMLAELLGDKPLKSRELFRR